MKTGRNDPCPCGSGNKYKRCCLLREEAERRESAQPSLWEREDAIDGDLADEDAVDDLSIVDVGDIRRVRYQYGLVKSRKKTLAGEGLQVREWRTGAIPSAILDSIEQEAAGGLDGSWGDPRLGDPMQVEVIEIETDLDLIVIEVFNRAILVSDAGDETVHRLHRLCGVLSASAAHDVDAVGPAQPSAPLFTVPTFGLEDATKRHRYQRGTCDLCGDELSRTGVARHLAACAPAHDETKGNLQRLVHLRVTAPNLSGYWLDVEVRDDARLKSLDECLRNVWLECCGHLSRFGVGGIDYFSSGYELGRTWSMPGLRAPRREQRSMSSRVREALPDLGGRFEYEYDFGSSTNLRLEVVGERAGRIGRTTVRQVARNTPLAWPCAVCGEPATQICPFCRYESENPFVCETHAGPHPCGESEGYLPVVNSPRMGVCGYTNET